jgi:fibro-slime domain-containing protein
MISTGGTAGKGTGGSGTGGRGGTGGSVSVGAKGGTDNMGGEAGATSEAVCGNDSLEVGELCDDGNTEDDDGCSPDCRESDPDYFCVEGEGCVRVVTCGNGVIEGDELCDDANEESDDGCSAACDSVEDGFACIKPGRPCVVLAVCGNGDRERGEQCDDGNVDAGDGCSDVCAAEPGYFCPPGRDCIPLECGDGTRTPEEACDDGDTDDGDGCASDCTIEGGWLCSTSGCRSICGDSQVLGDESCDDGNNTSGDGCSAACKEEPFYDCNSAEPSVCTSIIVCGDGVLHPGEVCDPGISGQAACYSPMENAGLACKAFDVGVIDPPVCNNGVVEFQEECDGAVTGCTNCQVDDGYVCPAANTCLRLPVCGDGLLQAGEECDIGLVSGPGCMNCQVENNYFCSGQPSVCVRSVCGDNFRAPDEECDDGPGTVMSPGTPVGGDGCSATCTVETGWACPPNTACVPVCGDGLLRGSEQCETAHTAACLNCRLRPGYDCGPNGTANPCTATVCANGNPTNPIAAAQPGEGCDDGNLIAGDGCGPSCQLEPAVTVGPNPTVAVRCGDGLRTGTEDCDDGNTTTGDGCSSSCQVEQGWTCESLATYPDSVTMAVTYRDFKSNALSDGHPHFENVVANNKGIAGTSCAPGTQATCGRLDTAGKPLKATGTFSSITPTNNEATASQRFAAWYRDTNALGISVQPLPGTLQLTRIGASDAYEYSSSAYFPLDGRGFGTTCGNEVNPGCCSGACAGRNFGFTTELRYFFQYQGGETLTFRGDDDVWVYINGRLAVDVGGVHCAQVGRVTLGDEDSSCSLHGTDYDGACAVTGDPPACAASMAEQNDSTDDRFGITKGGVYEIVLFHAERHTEHSNFRLTLQGFIAPRSFCSTDCGDSIRAGTEQCDSGRNMPASGYGVCKNNCTIEFCGDRVRTGPEVCDDGVNSDLYGSGCAPGCVAPTRCGDGILQPAFGEECDRGAMNANGVYGGCTTTCQLGPYCGDDNVDPSEDCDTPGEFTTYGNGPGDCNYDCNFAPYCGDNVRNGVEICDGTANCNSSCEYDPFCGDGLQTMDEDCDYGEFGFMGPPAEAPYGGCTNMCELGPYCGDDTVQMSSGEECDDGTGNVDNTYEGCTTACLFGPHCGDAVRQEPAGEACDNGFNEDEYTYPGAVNPCGPNCTPPPSCGDGTVQRTFELCDDGADNDDDAYDGCTTTCYWGPYCGDSVRNGPEECDDGPDNKAYSRDGSGCSYECRRNLPYCGDGVRNGPEECDRGTAENTGEYGGCEEDCTRAPYCGDGDVDEDEEECDDGPSGSLDCSTTCERRDDVK